MNDWPPKPGLDGHHQHLVELGQQVEVRLDGRAGLEGDAGAGADLAQPPCERDGSAAASAWKVTENAPGLGVARRPAVGVVDHQVHVERERRDLLQPLDHPQAEGEVRHEVVVHDVDVHEVGGGDAPELVLEVREVGSEDARVDPRRHAAA